MTAYLFHRDVFAPKEVFTSPGKLTLKYGPHARKAAAEDRYGDLTDFCPRNLSIQDSEIVEVTVENGAITKRVIRIQVSGNLDLVLVVNADGFVRTVWGNKHNDQHRTLNRHSFVQPSAFQH